MDITKLKWFCKDDLSNFEPIPIKTLDGVPVMLDGHTRTVVAVIAGLREVPLVWEEDEWDWGMYRRCMEEYKKRGITSPYDLTELVISDADYKPKWYGWCYEMEAGVRRIR